jgi:hypothetical protein
MTHTDSQTARRRVGFRVVAPGFTTAMASTTRRTSLEIVGGWLVNPPGCGAPPSVQKRVGRMADPRGLLGCQLGSGGSLIGGTGWTVGRSLPGTSLAFALMAAINGPAGSRAILTYGLKGTKPHRRQPDGVEILTAQRWRRKPSEILT